MNNNKKLLSLLLMMIFSLFITSCSKPTQTSNIKDSSAVSETTETQKVLGEIKSHYIDVGQGDCELIQVDGKNILIDAGTSDKKALNYLKSIGVTTLDYVIATHPHEDHIGSMDDVIKAFNYWNILCSKSHNDDKDF